MQRERRRTQCTVRAGAVPVAFRCTVPSSLCVRLRPSMCPQNIQIAVCVKHMTEQRARPTVSVFVWFCTINVLGFWEVLRIWLVRNESVCLIAGVSKVRK